MSHKLRNVASMFTQFKSCDFYLWDTMKGRAYVNNPQSLKELQENSWHEISAIPTQQLPACD
jgi:hypothetical protein